MSDLTKMALENAFKEALAHKPLEKITISELTNACGLSRMTFYYHFHDIYEVLTRYFIEQTDALLKEHESDESWEKIFIAGLNFLYENKTAIDHIYWSVDGDALDRFLDKVVYNYVRGVIQEESGSGRFSEKTISIAADFYKNALLGAVERWIEDDMNESPEQLAHLYNSVFSGTMEALLSSIEKAV